MGNIITFFKKLKIKFLQLIVTRKYRKSFRLWENIYLALSKWENDKGATQLRLVIIIITFLCKYDIIIIL